MEQLRIPFHWGPNRNSSSELNRKYQFYCLARAEATATTETAKSTDRLGSSGRNLIKKQLLIFLMRFVPTTGTNDSDNENVRSQVGRQPTRFPLHRSLSLASSHEHCYRHNAVTFDRPQFMADFSELCERTTVCVYNCLPSATFATYNNFWLLHSTAAAGGHKLVWALY